MSNLLGCHLALFVLLLSVFASSGNANEDVLGGGGGVYDYNDVDGHDYDQGIEDMLLEFKHHAPRSCSEEGLAAHGGRIPWDTVRSTDPESKPLHDLFDFRTFALRSPHGHGLSIDETDRVHDSLCSLGDKLAAEEDAEKVADVLHENFVDVLVGPNAAEHARHAEKLVGANMDTDLIGEVLDGGDELISQGEDPLATEDVNAKVVSEELRKDSMRYRGDMTMEERKILEEKLMRKYHATKDDFLNSTIVGAKIREFASSGMGKRFSASVFMRLAASVDIPIPSFPLLGVSPAVCVEAIMANNYRYLSGKAETAISISLPSALKPVVKVFVTLSGKAKVTASGSDVRAISTPGMIVSNMEYGIYANAKTIKEVFGKSMDGMKGLMNSANTPTHPSRLLALYTEGFHKEYVDLISDEWEYITEDVNKNGAASSSAANELPSDSVILDAIKRIEKMLEISPERKPDGTLVWKYTASSTLFSTKLFYRLSPNNKWTWSPDGNNWMDTSTHVVSGGKWKGQKPTKNNRDTIDAIKLIYVTYEGKFMTSPNGNGSGGNNNSGAQQQDTNDNGPELPIDARCSALGGICLDKSTGATCQSWVSGKCKGSAAIMCCVDNTVPKPDLGQQQQQQQQGPISAPHNRRGQVLLETDEEFFGGDDPCDCIDSGRRVGKYNPHAWGSQCRDWDRSGYDWCLVKSNCKEYHLMSYHGGHRRKCGFKHWVGRKVDSTAQVVSKAATTVHNKVTGMVGSLDAASKALIANAKQTMSKFKSQWRELKNTVKETGAFRFVKRQWFKGPRKPMRVFQELAMRMEEEGFDNEDKLLERGLFTADAMVFRDFTRILSIREALWAFCKKNAGVKGVMERMRTVLRGPGAFNANTTVPNSADNNNVDAKNKPDVDDPRYPYEVKPGSNTSGFVAKTVGVRKEKVAEEMKKKNEQASMDDENAEEMFAMLSEEIIERYEHIETMSRMVAARLARLGNPDWNQLDAGKKSEYRAYFYAIRRLAGGLHGLLKQINHGDGWLKRGVLKSLSWMKEKVSSACDTTQKKMEAYLGLNNWSLSSKYYISVQFGLSGKIPKLAKTPSASIEFNAGFSTGIAAKVKTKYLNDPTKTYSSEYSGPVVDGDMKLKWSSKMLIVQLKTETRHYRNPQYCINAFGQAPCSERFNMAIFVLPFTSPQMRAAFKPILLTLAATTVAGVGMDIARAGPDLFEKKAEGDGISEAFLIGLREVLHSMMPQTIASADSKDRVMESNIVNFAKNFGPQILVFLKLATNKGLSGSRLGFLSFVYTYQSGEGDNKMMGTNSAFIQIFYMAEVTSGLANKLKNGLTSRLNQLSHGTSSAKFEFLIDVGPLFWAVLPGNAKRMLAEKKAATSGAGNEAMLSAAQDESPCDQTYIASQLINLRKAVDTARTRGGVIRDDLMRTLRDMEAYESECSAVKK